ncbi:glucan endo-1,3-beta-glucosidase-like [Carex rostrata]
MGSFWLSFMLLCALVLIQQIQQTASIGVCYGKEGSNLPPPSDVVAQFKKCNFQKIRIFNPNAQIQDALRGQGIRVAVSTLNNDLSSLANDQAAANAWVNTNIVPYMADTTYEFLVVGNEVVPGDLGKYVAPAMLNLYKAIEPIGALSQLKITTAVPMNTLGVSFPPSASNFADEVMSDMTAIINSLNSMWSGDSILMVNAYPYFAYASDPTHIDVAYANSNSSVPGVVDGNFEYHSLIHAMLDSFYAALEKNGGSSLGIVVGETGWPSAGNGNCTTTSLSESYNLFFHDYILGYGTPRRPNVKLDGFLFEMFNENEKPVGVEQNFGLYQPNMDPVYPFC